MKKNGEFQATKQNSSLHIKKICNKGELENTGRNNEKRKMLSDLQIKYNRQRIIDLLRCTNRPGIDRILQYLEDSGFYTAPSSEDRHHNWKGGLAQHSLGVFEIAMREGRDLPLDSIIICGLLHDICKARMHYCDSSGKIHKSKTHIPGHGHRSIILLKKHCLELKDSEYLAIRWHMGGHYAKGEDEKEVIRAKDSRLWNVIHLSDKANASRND